MALELDGTSMILEGDRTLAVINAEMQEMLHTDGPMDDEAFLDLQMEASVALGRMKAGALLHDPEGFLKHFA